ncbi:hypothetical protein JCM8547_008954 [Rhodosporidiobolus lusitaniae]
MLTVLLLANPSFCLPVVRIALTPLAVLTLLSSIVTTAISGSLEDHWSKTNSFPSTSYRDRERILLAAGIIGIVVSIYSTIGTLRFADSAAFGIFPNLILWAIVFILGLIGASSLTALTDKIDCGDVDWSRCNVTKGLVAIGWIETIFAFIFLIIVFFLGVKARSGAGMRKSTFVDV